MYVIGIATKSIPINYYLKKKGNFDPQFPRYILSCKKDSMHAVPLENSTL